MPRNALRRIFLAVTAPGLNHVTDVSSLHVSISIVRYTKAVASMHIQLNICYTWDILGSRKDKIVSGRSLYGCLILSLCLYQQTFHGNVSMVITETSSRSAS